MDAVGISVIVVEAAFLAVVLRNPTAVGRYLGPIWQALKVALIPKRWRGR